ncbi:hypothetical protein F6X40_27735 [Paraburkholderia sp. UCT31]|uniref:hypothetical protein n=1 Tax=Paraburkholderia sp. UCT31 TaxID=2615209 RepID=UPI001654F4CF|nr:hypothetical protein [Paraburkholderia sp. UCT31]MBC8740431.1 hypothetical protein [Paraburkholderia sp. UCT31]
MPQLSSATAYKLRCYENATERQRRTHMPAYECSSGDLNNLKKTATEVIRELGDGAEAVIRHIETGPVLSVRWDEASQNAVPLAL